MLLPLDQQVPALQRTAPQQAQDELQKLVSGMNPAQLTQYQHFMQSTSSSDPALRRVTIASRCLSDLPAMRLGVAQAIIAGTWSC